MLVLAKAELDDDIQHVIIHRKPFGIHVYKIFTPQPNILLRNTLCNQSFGTSCGTVDTAELLAALLRAGGEGICL